MLTLAQIAAIISLLVAFGVPQDKTVEIRALLEHSQKSSTPITNTAPSVILKSMKPPYTKSELMHYFNDIDNSGTQRTGYAEYRYEPVDVINITPTSATVSLGGGGHAWEHGEVWMDGQRLDLHATNYAQELTGLSPNTVYAYTFKWIEDGREDTIIEGNFKTQI